MKRIPLMLTLLTTVVFISCEDANPDDDIDQVIIITSGQWNILFFFDENGDKAIDYTDYNFSFKKGGVVTAVRKNNIAEGTWLLDDVSNNSQRMVLDFIKSDFQPLDKEWVVNEISNNKIELIRFSKDGSENLVFVKH